MKKGSLSIFSLILLFSVFMGVNSLVFAEGFKDFGSKVPSEEDFVNALTPETKPMAPPTFRTRGIRPVPTKPSVETLAADTPAVEASAGISMQLTFNFNSDRLSVDAKTTLNNLGKALENKLANFAFRIEGHTDSVGSDVYNQSLSERRAKSVKTYLVDNFNVNVSQLETVGRGEAEPINPSKPAAAENRRVKIVTLGSR